jgi:predicted ATPase
MSELPSGTVTFLFTDIEGSTRLLEVLGERYPAALSEHRRVLRESVAAHRGVEVDTQGDAFFVAFARATDAIAAAQEAQARLASTPIRVRMGLHTGEPEVTEEEYVGLAVHTGARIAACGHGGQVLLSQSTRDLITAEVEDLGLHRLKDLSAPQRLYQLGTEDFPPLKTLYETHLPVAVTPFMGRARELADVVALIADTDVRLATLTGPGGVGKTRLAAQAAAEAFEAHPDGAWWVSLAALRDPRLVLPTVVQALETRGELAAHVGDKRMLLVLDNFEQVIEAAPVLAELLSSCPNLDLVITSREPLHLTGEQEYPVPPFGPDEDVAFFMARARAVEPVFAPDDAVPEICRRLDGLPLALELAAAWVKALSARQILDRLEQRLPLLTGGARDLPERQHTLRATIAWSYDLLTDAEQRLFGRLAVFAGGCTVEAAEEVCEADLDTVHSLIDKSLMRRTAERLWMLETISEYALERLSEYEGTGNIRARHAAYFVALAEATCGDLLDSWDQGQVDWFESEQANLRAALDWLHQQDAEAERECRLTVACARFWDQRGLWTEGRQRTQAAIAQAGETAPRLRAQVLNAGSGFASSQGESTRGKELAEAAIALGPDLEPGALEVVNAYFLLGLAEEALSPERAVAAYEQAAAMARSAGKEGAVGAVLHNIGVVALRIGDFTRARTYLEESLEIGRRVNQADHVALALSDLGFLALAENRLDEAEANLRESLALSRAGRYTEAVMWAVEGLASIALRRGASAEATRLLAATSRPRAELALGENLYPIGDQARAQTLDAAKTTLGDAAFAAAWAEGEALSIEDAADAAALIH